MRCCLGPSPFYSVAILYIAVLDFRHLMDTLYSYSVMDQ
jgi:hypothetical protein